MNREQTVERIWRWSLTALATLAVSAGLADMSSGRGNEQPNRVTQAANGAIAINGQQKFLIGAGWLRTADVPKAVELGINTFQNQGPGSRHEDISKAVANSGYVTPEYDGKLPKIELANAIGYALLDEPDDSGVLPPTDNPKPGKNYLPRTRPAAETGRLISQTITSRFMSEKNRTPGIGDNEYKGYIENASQILTDVYPLAQPHNGCEPPLIRVMSPVYDSMVRLKAMAPDKLVGEWIETGPVTGLCGEDPVPAPIARAEAWAAVAGGAQSIYWFTHYITRSNEWKSTFAITPAMADSIKRTNSELQRFAPILLAEQLPRVFSSTEDPIKVGARYLDGKIYLIAANLSDDPQNIATDKAGAMWRNQLPNIDKQTTVADLTTGNPVKAEGGRIYTSLPGYGFKIFSWPGKPDRTAKPAAE